MEKFRKIWLYQLFVFSIVILLFLGYTHCTFKTPSEAPTWNITLVAPLFDTTYTMQELADSTDELTIDWVDSVVVLEYEEKIDRYAIGRFLKADSAEREEELYFLPPARKDTTLLTKNVVIKSAQLDSGNVYLKVTNGASKTLIIDFTFYDLIRNDTGNLYTLSITIAPNQFTVYDEPITNCTFTPEIDPIEGKNRIIYEVKTQGSDTGNVNVELFLSDLVFSSVTGWFNEIEAPFDMIDIELDLPKELKGFKLGDAVAEITIDNQTEVPASLDLTTKASNEKGQIDSLMLKGDIIANGLTTLSLDGLAKLINLFPDNIETYGMVKLGKGYSPGINALTIKKDDSIEGDILLKAPLIFGIDSIANKMEIDTLEIKEDAQDAFRDNFRSAFLVIEVHNHLPFGFSFEVLFSKTIGDSTLYDLTSTPDLIKKISVKPGKLGPDPLDPSGEKQVVVDTTISKINFGLTKEEADVFDNPEVYMGMRFIFPETPPEGEFVKVRPTDYIKINAYAEVTANTKIPENNND